MSIPRQPTGSDGSSEGRLTPEERDYLMQAAWRGASDMFAAVERILAARFCDALDEVEVELPTDGPKS